MCGIVGCTNNDVAYVRRNLQKIKHRGPDADDVWHDDHVTLGHCLLAITDNAKSGLQPYTTPIGNRLVYNGEIFNYDFLKTKFDMKLKTTCDTEMLAWGLDAFNYEFVDHLDSMHGFVYYDVREQRLYLSRDHAGIKPLYYTEHNGVLYFASEIRALREAQPLSNQLDDWAISSWSHLGINFTNHTFHKGIHSVPPGATMMYDLRTRKMHTLTRYYPVCTSELNFNAEEFRSYLRESCRMVSRGERKLGMFLSGGLDSSSIAVEMTKSVPEIEAYTNCIAPMPPNSKEDFNSDHRCAVELADRLDIAHHTVTCTPHTWLQYLKPSIEALEQPVYNTSLPMYLQTNHAMAQNGVIVTIAGDMGDELLTGYPKYHKVLKHFGDRTPTWREVVSQWSMRLAQPPRIQVPHTQQEVVDYLIETQFPEGLYNTEDVLGSHQVLDVIGLCNSDYFPRNDRYGAWYGMEGRFPMATRHFMEYCLQIHSRHKIGKYKADQKILLKTAYVRYLPQSIINKPKTGWTAPYPQWSRMQSEATLLREHLPAKARAYQGQKREAVMRQFYDWLELCEIDFPRF